MRLVDANLLVYAKVASMDRHSAARDWLAAELAAPGRLGLPWASLVAFVRLVTNARIFPSPLGHAAAIDQVHTWLRSPAVWVPEPTEEHAVLLGQLLEEAGTAAELVPDAHLAAIALGHGLTVASTDSDFARFASVNWENPLS